MLRHSARVSSAAVCVHPEALTSPVSVGQLSPSTRILAVVLVFWVVVMLRPPG